MMRCLVPFIAGAVLFAFAAIGIGYGIWETQALVQGGAAFALAFIPAAVTLTWVIKTYRSDPSMVLLASLGGSGLRMVIALGGGYLLISSQPGLFDKKFWGWLILFYLGLLAWEIALLVRQSNPDSSPQA